MARNCVRPFFGVLVLFAVSLWGSHEQETMEQPDYIVFIAGDAAFNDFDSIGNDNFTFTFHELPLFYNVNIDPP